MKAYNPLVLRAEPNEPPYLHVTVEGRTWTRKLKGVLYTEAVIMAQSAQRLFDAAGMIAEVEVR